MTQQDKPSVLGETRHELLGQVERQVAQVLKEHGIATEVGLQAAAAVVNELCTSWAGSHVYIPMDYQYKVTQRDIEILGKFRGNNHAALAREYGMTPSAIYKLLKRIQDRKFERDQARLFD